MYTQTAYRCSFCHKTGLSKSHIVKHEEKCFKNPVTRSCATCANLYSEGNNNPFNEELTTECLAGIVFDIITGDDIPDSRKLKLRTLCGEWVERPGDEGELAVYQLDMMELKKKYPLKIVKHETPF